MNILENLNGRIQILDEKPNYGGEDAVKQVVETSPIQLPEDYIEFLKLISGQTSDGEENLGPEFEVEAGDHTLSLWIFSAQHALEKYREYKIDSAPFYDDIIDQIWLIGNDLGDLLYFYGNGKDGFGLYVAEDGSLCFEDADKIADTLTDFLVKGVGIDTAFWN
ncbi:MAG: SMI1/KNR4 family protein [Acetatifactor sp.]|nr:SMI1/KNR4 family protein [Acetatifactor sp.]